MLVRETDAEDTSPALVLAYAAAYAVGSALSYLVLRRLLGGLGTRGCSRFLVRLVLAAAVSTAVAYGASLLLDGLGGDPNLGVAAAARPRGDRRRRGRVPRRWPGCSGSTEVTEVIDTVTRRPAAPHDGG